MKPVEKGPFLTSPFFHFVSFLILFLSGCMASPQNQQIVEGSDPIQFGGSIPEGQPGQVPQGDVTVSDSTGETIGTFPVSQTNPSTDSVGKKWYAWGGSKIIPYRYWDQVPGKAEIATQMRASFYSLSLSSFDWVPPSNSQCEAALASNDMTAYLNNKCYDYVSPAGYPAPSAQCTEAKATGNLLQIINACKSSASPLVTLISKCGDWKEPCCKDSNPCPGPYECAEIFYDPNSPPDGAYQGVVGRAYNPDNPPPAGQEKTTLCLAPMGDGTLK